MLINVRNLLIAVAVVVLHGGVIFVMATAKGQVTPPEVIPIALLGTLVAVSQEVRPSDGASIPKPAVQPVVEPRPEPPVPVPPKPPVPEPVKPRPVPDTVKPQPRPQPRPRPESRPEPRQQIAPAETAAAPVEQSASSQTTSGDSGEVAAPATRGVSEGTQEVVAPSFNANYLRNPKPPYPDMSRRLREEGRVLLRVLISAEGTAKQVELKQSSGYKRLDDSALSTVKRWRFVPAKRGGQAIEMWYDVPVSFSLRG